ncbi:MAG: GNAT family N-acetyltransferase [Oscillospiraceae bacterium]|nr:GNAT family N-acetyltransferase [Oscillospiraceae bacterium]
MEYYEKIKLKDGRDCILRNGTENDAHAVLENFRLTHSQTDWLLTYPDECSFTEESEAEFLVKKAQSRNEIEILAEINGIIAGTAGINCLGKHEKIKHRAEFGISIDRAYWGLGIGRALTEACVKCAKKAGYVQLELAVVADNLKALSLYESLGFQEFGRNPLGFRSRLSGWQEQVMMRLELN